MALRCRISATLCTGPFGGEEFGIALPGRTTEDAVARIEHRCALLRRDRSDQEPACSPGFGVAERVREATLDPVFARADQALCDAKDNGRDRVGTVARPALGSARLLA